MEIPPQHSKESIQLLLPHEAIIVREILSTNAEGKPLKPGERPFTAKDLGQIAYSGFRIRRAQQIEAYFDRQFNSWKDMPRETPEQRKLRDDAKEKAEALKKEDIKNCIISLLRDKSASGKIPNRILDELARWFLPDILAFYETVEGREEYEAWKATQTQQTPQNAPQSP